MLTSFTCVSFESKRAVVREPIHFVGTSGTILAGSAAAFIDVYKTTRFVHDTVCQSTDHLKQAFCHGKQFKAKQFLADNIILVH